MNEEHFLRSMVKDFYNRQMLPIIIFVWIWAIIFIVGAVYTGIKFFETDQTKCQIMYAAIFVCFIQFISLMKIFAWQMIHRNNVTREIKKLRDSIAELNETVKDK
jgi:uncharacterized membrane protein YbjE (DUF340 family)